MDNPIIKRVLISVTDKTGIVEFTRALAEEFGASIVSTGGTARVLSEAGIAVTPIGDVTKFPEMMDGRVKTLHPLVHGALLARRDNPEHLAQAAEHGISMIDMVVVNLKAFEATVECGADFAGCLDHIDIGGTSLLRSAAKNHEAVTVVTNPATYNDILAEMRAHDGATTLDTRRALALEAFRITGAYDTAIALWLSDQQQGAEAFPKKLDIQLTKKQDLRYGENPHQEAALYLHAKAGEHSLAKAEQLSGKPLSYNNVLDTNACWGIVRELASPAVVILKHQNPCGSAEAATVAEAFSLALACDPKSALGGVIGANSTVTAEMVQHINDEKLFVEAIVAPEYEPAALELLAEKPNVRVLATHGIDRPGNQPEYRSVDGGVLVQDPDTRREDPSAFTVPTKRTPTSEEMADLLFAWKVVKGARSNAVLVAKDRVGYGLGPGQPNRVDSCEIACMRAGDASKGAVAASDAFFAFRDNIIVLARHGITAVIQPGGSIRDDETIAACDEFGIAMVFTGCRHFRY